MISRNIRNRALADHRDVCCGKPSPQIGKQRSEQHEIAKVRKTRRQNAPRLSAAGVWRLGVDQALG
jgi:hypothetical protein